MNALIITDHAIKRFTTRYQGDISPKPTKRNKLIINCVANAVRFDPPIKAILPEGDTEYRKGQGLIWVLLLMRNKTKVITCYREDEDPDDLRQKDIYEIVAEEIVNCRDELRQHEIQRVAGVLFKHFGQAMAEVAKQTPSEYHEPLSNSRRLPHARA